jgi:hypothetical protein
MWTKVIIEWVDNDGARQTHEIVPKEMRVTSSLLKEGSEKVSIDILTVSRREVDDELKRHLKSEEGVLNRIKGF